MNSDSESSIRETGYRLYDLMEEESGSIFSREYWTGKLFEWCMHNEAFKVQMFRFIDVFPYLKDARGTLVNLCSQAANYGVPTEVTYSASKFFVRGFTEALSIEWQKHGIYVCAIWPNFVDTPMMEKCSSIVSRRVGINLTTEDVVKTISRAVKLNMKFLVHWHVDTLFWRILTASGTKQPQFITRYIYKKIAGC